MVSFASREMTLTWFCFTEFIFGYPQKTKLSQEVSSLTIKIREVLMATDKMKDHQQDPEKIVALQYRCGSPHYYSLLDTLVLCLLYVL